MKKNLSTLLLGVGFLLPVAAATLAHPKATVTGSAQKVTLSHVAAPLAPPAAWAPVPFLEPVGSLLPNYNGLDAWKTYEFLQKLSEKSKKDDFETTAQYQARMANPEMLMSPLSPQTLYAFRMSPPVKYDADNQRYIVGDKYGGDCKNIDYSQHGSMVTCEIRSHYDDAPDYEGQNAYGAKATIKQIRGTIVSIAVDHGQLPADLYKKQDYIDSYTLTHELPMPLDQASALRGKTIAVLAIGYITGPVLIEGRGVYSKATISDPTDIAMPNYGIPFRLHEFIIYVVETGQILERISPRA